MRILTLLIGVILFASSCQEPVESNESQQETATSQPSSQPTSQPTTEPQTPTALPENTVEATYKNCTVYAGSTDYFFQNLDGSELKIRVSNLADERQIEIPENMTDPNSQEGPPGANPALVGETFLIFYTEGNVVKIELKE